MARAVNLQEFFILSFVIVIEELAAGKRHRLITRVTEMYHFSLNIFCVINCPESVSNKEGGDKAMFKSAHIPHTVE
jgi:hypothetical protein